MYSSRVSASHRFSSTAFSVILRLSGAVRDRLLATGAVRDLETVAVVGQHSESPVVVLGGGVDVLELGSHDALSDHGLHLVVVFMPFSVGAGLFHHAEKTVH